MARFIVIFEDRPEALHVRTEQTPAHLEYLDQHKATIVIAGPLRIAEDTPMSGAVWVVEAVDHDAVEALVQNDPFWRHGLRANYRIALWGKAPVYGDVTL
jgi:uncharacterized protein YciI